MSVTIILFYIVFSIFMLISYSQKPSKIIENIKSFILNVSRAEDTKKTVWDIPGPTHLPIVGTKWMYLTGKYKISKLHEAFLDMHKKYGDIVLEVDSIPIVNLFNRQDIEKVLKYPSKFPFRPPVEILECYRKTRPDRFKSSSLSNAQGEQWHYLRAKLTSNITSRKVLNAFLPSLNEMCDDFIDLIRSKRNADNCVVDFQDLANSLGLEAVCCLLLGRRMGYLSKETKVNEKFHKLAKAVKKIFVLNSDSYFGMQLWKYIPTKLYRDYVENEEIIYDIISEIVDTALNEEELNCADDDVRSIFISILQTEGLDIRDKKSGIIDLITGGIETFANTLSFVLFNLSQRTDAQDKINDEFTSCNGCITAENLSQATYTKACLQETFRISPTAICLARVLEDDFILSGYHLKAGSFVLCHTKIACQSQSNFSDAHKFVPERWIEILDDNHNVNTMGAEPGASLVLPFGVGKRMCPGKKFTEIKLTLITAKIFKEFQIEYKSNMDTQFQFLLAPKTPIDIIFRDRN